MNTHQNVKNIKRNNRKKTEVSRFFEPDNQLHFICVPKNISKNTMFSMITKDLKVIHHKFICKEVFHFTPTERNLNRFLKKKKCLRAIKLHTRVKTVEVLRSSGA